ncbi:MAG TPA: 6-phosphofructokinase [Pseudomonadales bacterium]|nr:6-phosphofructokinase [Pseudomonadales bacterium]
MQKAPVNAIYAQSGGVTSVINASACGVIETARRHPQHIGTVLAGFNGILGVLREELIDTQYETPETIAALRQTPGGAFGSSRYVLRSPQRDPAAYARLIEVFKAHNIGYFFYNGGNGSADTCEKIAHISHDMGYPIQAIHIPKTIDNDIIGTDCCPGFGSVAKYVATATRETGHDIASMASSSTKVFILEVMGRNAGWIAAASALAQHNDSEPPHIILFPEVAFDPNTFIHAVQRAVTTHGFCCVVASEGVCDTSGKFLSASDGVDSAGDHQLGGVAPKLAQLVIAKTGLKTHYAVADYLQRAARHMASATDVAQAYEVGVHAVEAAIRGINGAMVSIVRDSDQPYQWHCETIGLEGIATVERKLPPHYISQDGMHITPEARRYLQPLILGEDFGSYDAYGLPAYANLRNVMVKKQLPDWQPTD